MNFVRIQINDEWHSIESGKPLIRYFENERKLKGLCSHQRFTGLANCGLCLVEVESEKQAGRELVPSCRLLPVSGMKVWSHSSKALNYRQSVLSLFLAHLPKDSFLTSRKLLKSFTEIAQYSGLGFLFPSVTDRKQLKSEKVQNGLSLIPEICIGCGLCIDYTQQSPETPSESPVLVIKNNQVQVSFPKDVSPELLTSMSLHCPTGALVSERKNSISTTVLPKNQYWIAERTGSRVIATTETHELRVVPHTETPFVPEETYQRLDYYLPGIAFDEMISEKNDWSKRKLTWFLGKGHHQNISSDLKSLANRRREAVQGLFSDQTLPHTLTEKKPWTQGPKGLEFVIILGPEDQLTRAVIDHCTKLTESVPALIMLSRYDQLSPKLMSDLKEQGVVFAPVFDWLEQGMDTRFPRHYAHTWSCLNL